MPQISRTLQMQMQVTPRRLDVDAEQPMSEKSMGLSLLSHEGHSSGSSSVAVEATREDLIFAYFKLNKKEHHIWGRGCTFFMVLTIFLAVGCGLLRLMSFVHKRQPKAVDSEVFLNDFYPMGCFPILGNDAPLSTDVLGDFMVRDEACMNPEQNNLLGQHRCRSGLPFYRFTTGDIIPWRWCAKLCLLKGLDISGVVDAKECRCGASEQNFQVWTQDGVPRESLHFDQSSVVPFNSSACRIVAAHFLGPLPIEAWRTDVNEADVTYIRSIVSSKPVRVIEKDVEEAPVEKQPTVEEKPAIGTDWVMVALNSSCYPGPCSSGWAWPIWTVYKSGIPFAYDETVQASTKAPVQQAIRRLQQMTCVQFTEVSMSFGLTYKIVITEKDPRFCYCSPQGYPGITFRDSELNLGPCTQSVGTIMHEFGHALGMSHEQNRQDRDMYLKINWMNVEQEWMDQYKHSSSSYIGSKDVGFVPYDYRSVMHYQADDSMKSLPIVNGKGIHDHSMGQRRDFSASDVVQLRDMYQCDIPKNHCVDNEAIGNYLGTKSGQSSCLNLQGHCQHKKFGEIISYFCAETCNRCPEHPGSVQAGESGCSDTNEAVCSFLEDYCPGKVSGLEQYMSTNCRRRCCLKKFCANQTCPLKEESNEGEPTVVIVPKPTGIRAAMHLTFDCPYFETEQQLQQRLQLRFSTLLGNGVAVTLLEAPSCLDGCRHGKALVEQLCSCQESDDCFQSCSEIRLKWVLLSHKELSDFRGNFRVAVQSKSVDVPLTWEDLVAYSTQYRAMKYVAAVLLAIAILSIVLFVAVRLHSGDDSKDAVVDVVVKEANHHHHHDHHDAHHHDAQHHEHHPHLEPDEVIHTQLSQHALSDWIHQHEEEVEEEVLPQHNWCFQHRHLVLACVSLVALLSAGLMIYVDVKEHTTAGVEVFAPLVPSSSAPVFKHLGSFAAPGVAPVAAGPVEFYDNSCMRTGQPCGGLPFYRLKMGDVRSCAEFCLSKGLDLSGVVDGQECRCGASANHVIWKTASPRPDLHWNAQPVPSQSPECRIDAMKLSGPVGDVVEALHSNRDMQEKDLLYTTGIVRGMEILPPEPAPGPPLLRMHEKALPFSFVGNLSNETKDAFRAAAELIVRSTCVRFVEIPDGPTTKIRISSSDPLHCKASKVGWTQGVDLHLGWCNTAFHLGAILHELGHVMGLINEEQRSDRGDFVKSAVPILPGAVPLYYDIGSVMQGTEVVSVPLLNSKLGVHDPQIGQRSGLSAIDVLKLREIYACGVPPADIKVGICQQLMGHCQGGVWETWMRQHCPDTCAAPATQWLRFQFGFDTPGGFDLQNAADQRMLGDAFASSISQALAVSNTTVEVVPKEAKVQVACGCQGSRGRACRSCSTLEAQLRISSKETLQRWLHEGGFAQLTVLSLTVDGQGFFSWLLEDGEIQFGICFVGTLCATFAVLQAAWYLWWTRKVTVEAESDYSQSE